ncbi:hypothetical protein EHE21_08295 [Proteus sp. GOKU]|jgi:hypothetical protein|uniref:hypothetical protein n=1 Tax=Proteus TaxID=583 RepID=UPI0018929AF3|nr:MULTISPECIES: hypothetical protein [Proteus]QPB79380.1 hypothetical protein EHE21_08295 [Proteus sp. GOKU]QQP25387.1 hypothetical protein D7029_08295 [Proteus vulgaris]WPD00766.1 hypothetical protein R5P25_09715 [Proteus terrae]
MELKYIVKMDKKHTRFLLKAIEAVKHSDITHARGFEIENLYIEFEDKIHTHNGYQFYTIHFYQQEITQNNWMDATAGNSGGINVDLDINTCEVIRIYGER